MGAAPSCLAHEDVSEVCGVTGLGEDTAVGFSGGCQTLRVEELLNGLRRERVEGVSQESAVLAKSADQLVSPGCVGEVASASPGKQELVTGGDVGLYDYGVGLRCP